MDKLSPLALDILICLVPEGSEGVRLGHLMHDCFERPQFGAPDLSMPLVERRKAILRVVRNEVRPFVEEHGGRNSLLVTYLPAKAERPLGMATCYAVRHEAFAAVQANLEAIPEVAKWFKSG